MVKVPPTISSLPETVRARTPQFNPPSSGRQVVSSHAAMELAACAEARGINDENIICTMDEWEVVPRIAAATALKAQEQGLAELSQTKQQLMAGATERIAQVREAVGALMKGGIIASLPA